MGTIRVNRKSGIETQSGIKTSYGLESKKKTNSCKKKLLAEKKNMCVCFVCFARTERASSLTNPDHSTWMRTAKAVLSSQVKIPSLRADLG